MDIVLYRICELVDLAKLADANITDKVLEHEIGLPKDALYNWRNRVSKSYGKYLYNFAKYFHVSIEYLKGETDEKNPATTHGDGISSFDKSILDFVHSLPAEQLRAILVAVKAPTSLIDALDREEGKE